MDLSPFFFGMILFVILFVILIFSLLLTCAVRRYARRRLLDIPNTRSSHQRPSPRGGGLAIAVAFLAVLGLLNAFDGLSISLSAGLIGGGLMVAVIGWMDDHRHVPTRWRLLVHLAAAAWAVYWLGGLSSFNYGDANLPLGWAGHVLAVIGIVWMINLYNFMDGIDGLAAGEAVTVALVAAGLLWWVGATNFALVAASLAAACGGFLWWNWPPAKIFMGDVGSGFLGYCFAVFVLDATYTLASRVTRGEKWYTAHRSHAYQRLIQLGHPHVRVTSAVMLVNLLVLAPIAWLAVRQPVWTFVALPGLALMGWFVWRTIQQRFGKTSSHL